MLDSHRAWIEGRNIAIEYRFAEQKLERLPELATELVRLKVDLIVTSGAPTPLAAKGITRPTERDQAWGSGTEAKIEEIEDFEFEYFQIYTLKARD